MRCVRKNDEARMANDEGNPNEETRKDAKAVVPVFAIRASFILSSFVLRHPLRISSCRSKCIFPAVALIVVRHQNNNLFCLAPPCSRNLPQYSFAPRIP
jgi:hypothetical protein